MNKNSTNNKTIAKNASMLYLRMFVSMAISFFTSRVVLQALGVSDYGVYTLVGGIVVLINMLNSALTSSTTRFLTFNLGKGDLLLLKRTFSTAFIIHLTFAFIFLIIAETIGLWFINTHLNIDAGRMVAANWVYQSAIISTFLGITQVPYNALITSHERFGIFAYIDILNSILKLVIAIIVLHSTFDKLIFYSILYAIVAIAIMMIYRIYCIKNFDESKLLFIKDISLIRSMLSFSGWNLFGSLSLTISQQFFGVIFNWFFGTLINAALGVSNQVQSIMYSFIGNISAAFNPQIIKEYANKNFGRVEYLVNMGTKYAGILISTTSIPVICKMDYLMSIWLVEIPQGAVQICQIALINNVLNCFNPFIYAIINASGKVDKVNIFSSCFYLLRLPIVFITLKITHSYIIALIISLYVPISSLLLYICIAKKALPQFHISFLIKHSIGPIIMILFIGILLAYQLDLLFSNNLISFLVICLFSLVFVSSSSMLIVLNKSERNIIFKLIKNKMRLKR